MKCLNFRKTKKGGEVKFASAGDRAGFVPVRETPQYHVTTPASFSPTPPAIEFISNDKKEKKAAVSTPQPGKFKISIQNVDFRPTPPPPKRPAPPATPPPPPPPAKRPPPATRPPPPTTKKATRPTRPRPTTTTTKAAKKSAKRPKNIVDIYEQLTGNEQAADLRNEIVTKSYADNNAIEVRNSLKVI